jgi:hypothetical protein
VELHGARLTSRVVVSVASAAAIAALFGAGSASAATTGTVALSTAGTSVSAAIDATTTTGETIKCKFDVVNQDATSTTKTAWKEAESAGTTLKQTLTIENLKPGKYDAKVHCQETVDGTVAGLDKTGVLTVTGTPGGNTTPPPVIDDEEDDPTAGFEGIISILQGLLGSLFES